MNFVDVNKIVYYAHSTRKDNINGNKARLQHELKPKITYPETKYEIMIALLKQNGQFIW